ncbi:hypothetical protein Y032_0131g1626 [Ancylostoma ceylanicum]|uniref:Uncharacterized protein n=1 Tax=Ancylostoma ceylanicum TaxID=53326 RepID=A0A016T623_9BILA|nr:hypothetical protein Y032_0131g1626 [Ancylostoma ceylanicum]
MGRPPPLPPRMGRQVFEIIVCFLKRTLLSSPRLNKAARVPSVGARSDPLQQQPISLTSRPDWTPTRRFVQSGRGWQCTFQETECTLQ